MGPVGEVHKPGLNFYSKNIRTCDDTSFHEMTGKVGDVILLHPLMIHSASKNGRRLPRIITNPPVSLNEPFIFNRKNPGNYSLVELKTLKELGKESLPDWKITSSRQRIVPERVRRWEKMMRDEKARLEAIKSDETPRQTPLQT